MDAVRLVLGIRWSARAVQHAGPASPKARRGGSQVGGRRSSPRLLFSFSPFPFLWHKASFWHKAFFLSGTRTSAFTAHRTMAPHCPVRFPRGRSRVRGKGEALSSKPRRSFPFSLPVLHPLTAWHCNPLHACMHFNFLCNSGCCSHFLLRC